MICFAVCVGGDGSTYARSAGPTLDAVAGPDDEVWTVQGAPGICTAYNDFLDRARALPECEALVLLHDDVELIDPHFRERVLAAVREPDVGVVGIVGGADLYDGCWWESRRWGGEALYTPEVVGNFDRRSADVDVVDGFLMVLSRRALETLRFDERTFPAWHGYDTDLGLAARRAGLRVVTRPVEVLHRTKATLGDAEAFHAAKRALRAKYPDLIRRRSPLTWSADTAERAARKARRLRGRRAPVGQQVGRRAGSPAPAVDPWRVRALGLHDLLDEGVVLHVGGGPAFAAAARAEGYEVAAPAAATAEALRAWSAEHPPPQGVALWHVGAVALGELVAAAARAVAPGGVVVLEEHHRDGVDAAGLERLLADAGLRDVRARAVTGAAYVDREQHRDDRRRALLAGEPWPQHPYVRASGTRPDAS